MYLSNNENLIENIKAPNQKNIILDYGGPNIGKPLHVGHLRSLNIGRSLYNINKLAGHNVVNDVHLGDWGMPIAQIICFINEKNINFEDIKIEDLEEIYPKASKLYQQNEDFKSLAQNINKELNENSKISYFNEYGKTKFMAENSLRKWFKRNKNNKKLHENFLRILSNALNENNPFAYDLSKSISENSYNIRLIRSLLNYCIYNSKWNSFIYYYNFLSF